MSSQYQPAFAQPASTGTGKANVITLAAVEGQATPQTITALPNPVNLVLYAGDDFYLDITVTDEADAPVDLSSGTVLAQVRVKETDPSPKAVFEVLGIDVNVIHLHLDNAESTKLTGGVYVWDAQVAMPEITTLVAGKITVTAEVSR